MVSAKEIRRGTVSGPLRTFVKYAIVFVVATAVMTGIALIPVPYVIQKPGPTIDVLGTQGDLQVLEIGAVPSDLGLHVRRDEGSEKEQQSGATDAGTIRMVTVSEVGGPGSTVRVRDVVTAWFQKSATVLPYKNVYPSDVTAAQVKEVSTAQMESSHSTSQIAAFDYLGVPLETTMTVIGTVPGGGSEGVLEEGDILKSITLPNGSTYKMTSPSVPFTLMRSVAPDTKVSLEIVRDGEVKTVEVVTQAPPVPDAIGPEEGSKMGAYLSADADSPVDVAIHLERIGGPSAGLPFALGIIDQFTEGGIAGNSKIAATGALDYSAYVTPVGGIRQKMFAAKRDGAEWFLLPWGNCADAVDSTPAGLTVVPVSTLKEGLDAVEHITSGETGDLPVCPVS